MLFFNSNDNKAFNFIYDIYNFMLKREQKYERIKQLFSRKLNRRSYRDSLERK